MDLGFNNVCLHRLRLAVACVAVTCQVEAKILFVDSTSQPGGSGLSWEDAFQVLEDALAHAAVGDEIWVAGGTYRNKCKSCSFVVPNGVNLYGGFSGDETSLGDRTLGANPSILSGDVLGDDDTGPLATQDNASHVLLVVGATASIVIDGFTIRDGFAQADGDPAGYYGGGGLCSGSSLVVRNCTFIDDDSLSAGGALACLDDGALVVEGCVFESCQQELHGAAVFVRGGSAKFNECVFTGNFGRGLYCSDEAVVSVQACKFIGNLGGGVTNEGPVTSEYAHCLFIGNTASGSSTAGGGMLNWPGIGGMPIGNNPVIRDCLFVGNVATGSGGAIDNTACHPTIIRTTIVGNHATFSGGGVTNYSGSIPFIRSCIVWGNEANGMGGEQAQIANFSAAINIAYSCVEGWTGALLGPYNIGSDPEFVDIDGADDIKGTLDDDPRLAAGSPCIDTGDSRDLEPGVDVFGMPRVLDGDLNGAMRVDMGCAEFGNVGLSWAMETTSAGETLMVITIAGPSTLTGMLLIGWQAGLMSLPPYGSLLFDLSAGWARFCVGPLPATLTANVTSLVGVLPPLTVQALGIDLASGAGNLSKAVTIDLEP